MNGNKELSVTSAMQCTEAFYNAFMDSVFPGMFWPKWVLCLEESAIVILGFLLHIQCTTWGCAASPGNVSKS